MWRKYFKTPFVNGGDIYIFDAEGHPVADFMMDFKKGSCDNIVKCINDDYLSTEVHDYMLSEDKDMILRDGVDMIRMRGWGYLTGTGGHNMSPILAVIVQNSMAEFICEKLNQTRDNQE